MIKNKKTKLYFIYFIFSLLLIGCAAYQDSFLEERVKFIAKSEIEDTGDFPDHISFIVDGTGSMKGFSSSRTQPFEDLLRSFDLFSNDIQIDYYSLYAEYLETPTILKTLNGYDALLSYRNNQVYNGLVIDFSEIDNLLNKEITDPDNLKSNIILVTDLQFNKRNILKSMANLFNELIFQGYYITMYVSQMDFNGNIYLQMIEGEKVNGSNHKVYSGNRPLFLFSICPPKYFEKTNELITKSFPWTNKLHLFSTEKPFVKLIDQSSTYDVQKKIDNNSFHISTRLKTIDINIQMELSSSILSEWSLLSDNNITINLFSWNSKDTIYRKINNVITTEINLENRSNGNLFIDLSLFGAIDQKQYLCEIIIHPQDTPKWIDDLSMDLKDSSDLQIDHVIFLSDFIKSLLVNTKNPVSIANVLFHIN